MKLICLNTWGGRHELPKLLDFFRAHEDVDFFCLQEIWAAGSEEMKDKSAAGTKLRDVSTTLLSDIQEVLPDHCPYFEPIFRNYYGIAMYVRSGIPVSKNGSAYVYREEGFISPVDYADHARKAQYVVAEGKGGPFSVINTHGLWQPGAADKRDNPDRLLQSDRLLALSRTLPAPQIIAGDFNLRPDTESVERLRQAGFRDLVSEYGLTSTRTSLYTKPERYADFVFVSEGVDVNEFRALPDEVSDHAALYLEFN